MFYCLTVISMYQNIVHIESNGNIQQYKLTFLINKRKNSDMIHIAETFMKVPFLHFQFTFPLARWIFCTTSANTMWLSWGIWLCNFFHFGLASRF